MSLSTIEGKASENTQVPLPLIPAEAVPIGLGVGLFEDDNCGVVFIWGQQALFFDKDDLAARRFAAVQLVLTKVAKPSAIAVGFGVSPSTLLRWKSDFIEFGLAGLIEKKKGPTGPHKLTDELRKQINFLRETGKSLREIALMAGCSPYLVRVALGLVEKDLVRPGKDLQDQVEVQEEQETNQDTNRASSGLEPLAQPRPRSAERSAACFGLIEEAEPVFTQGAGLGRLGILLILPALEETGLIKVATSLYRRMANGFYGLNSIILMMVFLSLLREPRAESASRLPPKEIGCLLGLDRAPEVKTIRRKLKELEKLGLGSKLVSGLARNHAKSDPDSIGYLYVDGHIRVYAGKRDLQKNHVTRTRIAAPATLETWVNDSKGDPLFVVTLQPSASLVTELRSLLPKLRSIVGEKRVTIAFDRGGWSPDLFKEMVTKGFDFFTYRKGKFEPVDPSLFIAETYIENNTRYTYDLYDSMIEVPLSNKSSKDKVLNCREIIRKSHNGHQIRIVTSRLDLSASQIGYRMFSRWRQENYFRYGRMHFSLDGLDSYKACTDDLTRSVPNPQRKMLQTKLKKTQGELGDKLQELGTVTHGIDSFQGSKELQLKLRDLDKAIEQVKSRVEELQTQIAQTPTRVPLGEIRPEATLLDEERKLITHAIRMSTYNAESYLARMLIGYFRADESRTLIQEIFNSSGDLEIIDNALHVRIDPLSAPRRTKALEALCVDLNATNTTYPGTDLILRYSVKRRHGIS